MAAVMHTMLQRRTAQPQRAGRNGFTLVELMVALTIGLVLALAISLSMLSMGRQFRVVGATSSAQVNAQLALSLIDNAGRAAGAGLFNNGRPVCPTFNAWNAGTVVSNGAVLLPARIIDGGSATASDRVVFSTSTATGPLSGMPVLAAMGAGADPITVTDGGRIEVNDLAIVGVPGSATVPCRLFQVTAVATDTTGASCGGNANRCKTLSHTVGGNYNPPTGTFGNEARYGFADAPPVVGPAVVMGLGTSFRQEAFAVFCETLVQYDAFSDSPSCTTGPLNFAGGANALVTDVVLMHVQYGISGPSDDIVTTWVDATGPTWASPSAADTARIKALRVVVVSRSKEAASELVTTASCTNTGGVVNTGPCSFDDAEAPVIDLSGTSVPSGRSWRNYRYRVQQAVVPLRNVIWSN
jgi:type IV pilus assembly protein PilW